MYDKFLDTTLFMDHLYEVNYFFPLVPVINAQPALDCDWNSDLLTHFSADLCKLMGVEHKNGSKSPISGLLAWATAVNIYLVKAPLLDYFSCLSHFFRVIASKLKNNRVLIWSVIQESFSATMNDCILINHFCIKPGMFAEMPHQKSEILV